MILSYILWLATDIYTTVYGIRYINTDISLVYISVTNNKCDRTAGGELVWRVALSGKFLDYLPLTLYHSGSCSPSVT